MKQLNRILTSVENTLAVATLAAAAVIAIVSVVLRNLTGAVVFWAEEATIYLIIYSTFIGAVATLRSDEHVNIDILPVLLKGTARKAITLIGRLVTIGYMVSLAVLSWMLIAEPFSRRTITPALKLPLWVLELSVAIGFTLMALRSLELAWRTWRTPRDEIGRDVYADELAAAGFDQSDLAARNPNLDGDRSDR
ncbi:TRAP transporter small permease [Enemella evansiae]|nr:TRAP transporter small permease [Enemella evansiae]PFG67470.1 TRAP-type C4-dicarboxylate transport system permease small subunit [Propionibacteriaceae bacterium ES.041]OYN99006.1 hypothetical protein CGZ96_07025 [Enemella evansiae]OYO01321.1 hypothetical protein CGZ97_18030 [Enemella evansiae]OYO04968.1 hypothetical protein CGZ95_01260 [Enemella evansiae]OYO07429.1 hypothetical protein CGZ98_18390 [Enemella evansiae]